MAQVDVQWPSEDEDFDAVTDKVTSDTAVSPRRVAITTEDNNDSNDNQSDESQSGDNESHQPAESQEELRETEASFFKPDHEIPAHSQSEQDDKGESESQQLTEVNTEESREEPENVEPETEAEPEPESHDQPEPETQPVFVAPVNTKPPKAAKSGRGKRVLRLLFELILIAGLAGVGYYAYTLHNDKTDLQTQVTALKNDPQLAVQKQTDELIHKVGLLIQLPTDEAPTIANVSDASQAKKQSAFFNDAQNGDKVLMYAKAGKAILYRPSTNKIVLQAPLTFTSNTPATSSTTTNKTTPATTPKTTP